MKTFTAKSETVQRDWYLVDATGKTLGRLSSELARRLRGKHKPVYTPHVDTGDYIIVINAEKIHVTGKKLQDKMYHRFTGYVGNLKTESLAQALERHPERVLEILADLIGNHRQPIHALLHLLIVREAAPESS